MLDPAHLIAACEDVCGHVQLTIPIDRRRMRIAGRKDKPQRGGSARRYSPRLPVACTCGREPYCPVNSQSEGEAHGRNWVPGRDPQSAR